MSRTWQLPVRTSLPPLTGVAFVLWTLLYLATPTSGWAAAGFCRDCPADDKGTGETRGSNIPRDSKTKAPGDSKSKAAGDTKTKPPDCDGMRQKVDNMCRAYDNCADEGCRTEIRNKVRDLSNQWAGSACGQGSGIGCGGAAKGPGTTGGQTSAPGSTGGGGGSSGGSSGGGGSGGGNPGKGGGGDFGGGRGGRKAFLVPSQDIKGPRQEDSGKGIWKWLPWRGGPTTPGPGTAGSGSPWAGTPPLRRERLPELLAALDQFGAVNQTNPGTAGGSSLGSILEGARRESDPSRQAENLKAAIPHLIEALANPESPVRREAANALGKMGQGAGLAIPPLVEGLADQDESVRKSAAGALTEIAQEFATATPKENDPKRQAEIQKLFGGLQNSDPATRRQSAEKLGRMGRQAGPAMPALVHKLQDQDATVRNAATDALRNIGRSFERQDEPKADHRRAALCVNLSWTGLQISASSCDLAAQ